MLKRSIIISVFLIIFSITFNFTYSQTPTSTEVTSTTSSSTNSTPSEESGDVYTRANETYKYVSSFDGSETVKTFDNQNTRDVGTVFNYLLTLMAVAIVLLVIYRLLQGAVIKGTFDNIYDQTKGRSYIKTAGTALIIFIFAYAILSFINPDLTGWTVATEYAGKVRIEGVNNGGTGGSGAYTSAYAWQCPINPGGFDETQKYVKKVQGYQKEKPWEGSGPNSGCKKYDAEFTKVASESGIPKDFLMAIGTQESGACSSLSVKSDANAYGLMQILDGTASSAGCDSDWKSTGYKQISCAAKVIKSKQSLHQSKNRPSIGFTLSGTIQNIEGYTFDTGNANLIASYNGGPGEGTTKDGKKQAFAASSDCKGSTGGGSLYNMEKSSGNTDTKLLLSAGLLKDSENMTCPNGTKDLGTVRSKYTGSGQVKGPLIRLCQLTGIIDGKGDDTTGKNVTNGAVVNVIAAQYFVDLAKDAKAAGVVFRSTSSFRYEDSCVGQSGGDYNNPIYKERVASGYCAPAGSSLHQLGIAIDIAELYDDSGPPAKIKGGTCSGTRATASKNDNIFNWLKTNANKHKIYNYASEVWHWEFSPPSNNRC